MGGEGMVHSKETMVLPDGSQGLRWLRRCLHESGLQFGLWRWGTARHSRCSGCCHHWDSTAQPVGKMKAHACKLRMARFVFSRFGEALTLAFAPSSGAQM